MSAFSERGLQQAKMEEGEVCRPVQYTIYADDSVDVYYSDNSTIQLSPCGLFFVHYSTADRQQHPAIVSSKKRPIRSQFATSQTKSKIKKAIDFRNHFAKHPVVIPEFYQDKDFILLPTKINVISWPRFVGKANILENKGKLHITSIDECCVVTLATNKQGLTFEFLTQVSQTKRRKDASYQDSNGSDHTFDYVWTAQFFSIHEFPEEYKHPVNLLLEFSKKLLGKEKFHDNENQQVPGDVQNKGENECLETINCTSYLFSHIAEESTDKDTSQEYATNKPAHPSIKKLTQINLNDCVETPTIQSLPLTCSNTFLHKWNTPRYEGDLGNQHMIYFESHVKVTSIEGILYRLLWGNPRSLEIYPGDGSILISSGMAAHFFAHLIHHNGKLEERMYCVQSLPPHIPGSPYSIAKLIKRGSSLFDVMNQECLQLLPKQSDICWQVQQSSNDLVIPSRKRLVEECVIEDKGKFSAFSNGHIRVLFNDRIALDLCNEEFEKRHDANGISFTRKLLDIPEGYCRLLLQNGHYKMVSLQEPSPYIRYVEPTLEWCKWVNTEASKRHLFYAGTSHDVDKQRSVEHELKKIKCFNYVVENTLLPKPTVTYSTGAINSTATVDNNTLINQTVSTDIPSASMNQSSHMALVNQNAPLPSGAQSLDLHTVDHFLKQNMDSSNLSGEEKYNYQMAQQALEKTKQALGELDAHLAKLKSKDSDQK